MNKSSIILKSTSYLLLVVMLYMHVCSAFCAISGQSCCGIGNKDTCQSNKICCKHKKNTDSKDHDCQDMHLSFFNITGQFALEKGTDTGTTFHSVAAIVPPLFILKPVDNHTNPSAYNGFHPPPRNADIRIFIQSFQI